ncbi:MAG: DNA photolyase [Calditrichaeota bacterium]|nr:MAG: DNA photolyase [Calditrichota bacterium]
MKIDYSRKFENYIKQTLFDKLTPQQQKFIREIAFQYRFTFQELRQIVEIYRDLTMWGEGDLAEWWNRSVEESPLKGELLKNRLLKKLQEYVTRLKRQPKSYPQQGLPKPRQREKLKIVAEASDKKIYGMCPVASDKTVCCNLRVIDVVERCAFGCSYCTIQTFYSDQFVFDKDLVQKLKSIPIEPNRYYHFGTGQSSDSLVWGNKFGILDALFEFALEHPNVLLEFKTKSNNIRYLLEHDVPPNIVCSWSLNTPTIIKNEEHFTASLEQRLDAARQLASKGVGVAFHFHPMVYYKNWEEEYACLATELMNRFKPEEVLFVSFGSVTFIKPVIKQIRKSGLYTKMTQMEMVTDPHGKLTYPDDVKIHMFRHMYQALSPWHGKVFFYLCMEKSLIWERVFGFVYKNNEEFENDFLTQVMQKIYARSLAA